MRVRTRGGEPGVTVLGGPHPLIMLRHREPAKMPSHRHGDLMASAAACPPAEARHRVPLPDDDGHGDAHDPVTCLYILRYQEFRRVDEAEAGRQV